MFVKYSHLLWYHFITYFKDFVRTDSTIDTSVDGGEDTLLYARPEDQEEHGEDLARLSSDEEMIPCGQVFSTPTRESLSITDFNMSPIAPACINRQGKMSNFTFLTSEKVIYLSFCLYSTSFYHLTLFRTAIQINDIPNRKNHDFA